MALQSWVLINLLLIVLIFFQMPKDTVGLTSFVSKTNFLGSSTTVEKAIKFFIAICIIAYIFLAFELNKNV